jgi:hypothetical protein
MNDAVANLSRSFIGTLERLKEVKTCEIVED